MTQEKGTALNGYETRSKNTKAKLLRAAEIAFARYGFDGSQMDEIAKAAGRSKGAIYAHYKSKDDLFLALLEEQGEKNAGSVFEAMKNSKTPEEALRKLQEGVAAILKNGTFLLLLIEAKLHAIRDPMFRKRWLAQNLLLSREQQKIIKANRGAQLLLAAQTPAQRSTWAFRMHALGPILNGFALEAAFEPEQYTPERISKLCKDLVGFLISLP